jgi:hypothetical protein
MQRDAKAKQTRPTLTGLRPRVPSLQRDGTDWCSISSELSQRALPQREFLLLCRLRRRWRQRDRRECQEEVAKGRRFWCSSSSVHRGRERPPLQRRIALTSRMRAAACSRSLDEAGAWRSFCTMAGLFLGSPSMDSRIHVRWYEAGAGPVAVVCWTEADWVPEAGEAAGVAATRRSRAQEEQVHSVCAMVHAECPLSSCGRRASASAAAVESRPPPMACAGQISVQCPRSGDACASCCW